ncbi:MAG TPA: hypothetical protein VMH05_09970 [Bryobacteraceae bacterium]|nr:hypothetical protein [Bryobacteraceae bacterium]
MIKSAADSILGVWNAPEVPLRVEYPLDIMEELRGLVCDDLQRLSRGGADAAGLLFGVTRGPVARILTWCPISRGSSEEQTAGPALHDRAELVRVLSGAATDPAMHGMEPLGWFVSRTQGGTGLTSPEIELFNNFFPNPWQVTLLLRRAPGGTARAGFFVREPDGFLRPDASYRELLIQPLRRMPKPLILGAPQPEIPPVQESQPLAGMEHSRSAAIQPVAAMSFAPEAAGAAPAALAIAPEPESIAPAAMVIASDAPLAVPEAAPGPATQPVAAAAVPIESSHQHPESFDAALAEMASALQRSFKEPPPSEPARKTATAEAPPIRIDAPRPVRPRAPTSITQPETLGASPLEAPSFVLQTHSFGGRQWLWILPVLLAVALVVFLVMQKPAPAPVLSFSLRVAAAGNMVEISWDRDSIPVYKGDHASIKIQDGADTKQISLNSEELHTGKTHYVRETGDVAFLMTIYNSGSQEFHEFARLVAPSADAANPTPAPEPADSIQLSSDRDKLEAQVNQLKEQVRKEAARADQAESVVRILENRLNIDGARSPSQADKK